MDRKQFDGLEIKLQIDYINKELNNQKTITATCEDIGISRSALRKRFKKAGYIYDTDKKEYLDNTIVTSVENTKVHSSNTEVIPKMESDKNSIQVHLSNTRVISDEDYPSDTTVISKKEVVEMVNLKSDIVKMMHEHKELMQWYELQKSKDNVIDIPTLKIEADKLTGESKRKVFVLHKGALDQFMEFAENHKEYTIKDMVSQALIEFVEKYNRK